MSYKKPKYAIGIQSVDVRPGSTGAARAADMSKYSSMGSTIGSTAGSAFGPVGSAIGGAIGAVGGAAVGWVTGGMEEDKAAQAKQIDEYDQKEVTEQNISYGGQENKQLKNAKIMQNNAGLIADKGMKKAPSALVEVEGQELVYRRNGRGKYQLVQDHGGGPTHEQGGIDTWVKEGDVITPAKDRGVYQNITNPVTGEVMDDAQFEYFKNKLPEDNQKKPVKSMMEHGTKCVKPRYFMGGLMGMMGGGGGGGMMSMLGGGGGGGGGMTNPIGGMITGALDSESKKKTAEREQLIATNAQEKATADQALGQIFKTPEQQAAETAAAPTPSIDQALAQPSQANVATPTPGIQPIQQPVAQSPAPAIVGNAVNGQLPIQRQGNRYVKPQYGFGATVEVDPKTGLPYPTGPGGQTIDQTGGSAGSSTETRTSTSSTTPGKTETKPGTPSSSTPNPNAEYTPGVKTYDPLKNPEMFTKAWGGLTPDQVRALPPEEQKKGADAINNGNYYVPGKPAETVTTDPKVEVKEEIKKESTPGGDPNANQNEQIGGPIDVRSGDVIGGDNNITFEKGMFGPSDAAVAEQEKTKRAAEANRAQEALPNIPPPQQFEYGKYQMPAGKMVAPDLNFDPASPTYQQYQDLSDPLRNKSQQAMNADMSNARELSGGSVANARSNMAQASASNFDRQAQIDTQEMGRLSQVDAANRQTDNQYNMYNNQGANAAQQANATNRANVTNENTMNANMALNTNLNAMQTDRASGVARKDYEKYTRDMQIERDRRAMEIERQNKLIYGVQDNNPFSGHRSMGTQGPQDTDTGPVEKWFPNRGGSTTPDPNSPTSNTPIYPTPDGLDPRVPDASTPGNSTVPETPPTNTPNPSPDVQPVPDAPLPNTPDMKPQAGGYVSPGKELPTGPSTMPLFKKGSKYVKPRYAEGGEVDEDETEETDAGTADIGDAGFTQYAKENPNSTAVRLAANSLDKKRALYDYKAKRDLAIEENKTARHADYYDMVRSRQQRINQTGGATGIGDATESQTAPVTDTATGTTTSTTSRTGTSGNPGANQNQQFAAPIDVKSGDVIGGDNNIVFPSGGGYGYNNQGQPQAPISPPPPTLNPNGGYTNTPGGPVGPLYGKAHRRARRDDGDDYRQKKWLEEQKEDRERIAAKTETKNAKTQGKYARRTYGSAQQSAYDQQKLDQEAAYRLQQSAYNNAQSVEDREAAQEFDSDMAAYNQQRTNQGIMNRGENREQRGYNQAQGQERRQQEAIDRVLHRTRLDEAKRQRKAAGNTPAFVGTSDVPAAEAATAEDRYGLPKERNGNAWVRPNYSKKKSKS